MDKPTPISNSLATLTADQTASISAVDVANQIDGHLSYFDVDSATLRTPTISGLLFVAEYLEANPDQRILVEGHCDERGTRDYNLALGEKRAEAIRRQLVRQGIDRRRIKTKSFGKERPAMLGASPEAWPAGTLVHPAWVFAVGSPALPVSNFQNALFKVFHYQNIYFWQLL